MNPFLREKKDGRRTAGYLVYLLGAVAIIAAALVVHRSSTAGKWSAPRQPHRGQANVAPITQPAAVMAPVSVPARSASRDSRSYRIDRKGAAGASAPSAALADPSFNAINAALAPIPESAPPSAGPSFAPLPPAFPPEEAHADKGKLSEKTEAAQLLAYRDKTADNSGPVPRKSAPAADGSEFILPRGTLICVYLLTTVDSANPAAVLQFGVAKSVVFNRRRQLDFGTRFLGRLSAVPVRDRVSLSADTVLFPDGLELPASASAVEADETGSNVRPGVAAYYFPPPQWAQLAPYVSNFFTGFMGLLESRAQPQLAVGLGGLTVQSSPGGDPRVPLFQASAQAIQDFTRARLKEIERRYADCYLVPAGTAFWLQLDTDLDLRAAHAARRLARSASPVGVPLSDASAHALESSN